MKIGTYRDRQLSLSHKNRRFCCGRKTPVRSFPANSMWGPSAASVGTSLLSLLFVISPAKAQLNPAQDALAGVPGKNTTQTTMAVDAIGVACPRGGNTPAFQQRCNAVVGAALADNNTGTLNALQQVSPEQTLAPQVQGTRVSGGQVTDMAAIVTSRLAALRAGLSGTQVAGVDLTVNGQPVYFDGLASIEANGLTGGAASADSTGPLTKFGAFLNVTYNWGDVDSTFDQKGFDFNNWGITAGADYRFTHNIIGGAAFTFFSTDADFDRSAGNTQSDSYSGSLYGTFYPTERAFVDAIATFGALDYDIERRIGYSLSNDTVNTMTRGEPGGDQYYISVGGGYDFPAGQITVSPYLRAAYQQLDLDSYQETGGNGWAMAFDDYEATSITTTLGAQASYAVSTAWGVLVPQLRAEWVHEYDDAGDDITVAFLGDPARTKFTTFSEDPDRDYFNIGAEVAATFARGISAFLAYNALLGYSDITSNTLVGGARMEF